MATFEQELLIRELEHLRRRVSELEAEAAKYSSMHDPVTGLAGKGLLYDRLTQAVAHARRAGKTLCVLFLRLDHLKVINDTLGQTAGDMLLKRMARILGEMTRKSDTVARPGRDEFVLVLADIARPEDAALVAGRIVESLSAPIGLMGKEIFIKATIGIGVFPHDGDNADSLLRCAYTAMEAVGSRAEGSSYSFYSPEMNTSAFEKLQTESGLRLAISRGEFVLHYQPQFDIKSRRVTGTEALIRWSKGGGIIPPSEFIPLAEDSGLIVSIGEWVLKEACRQNKKWQEAGLPPIRVAVNLSARQFSQHNLVEMVKAALHETGMDPSYLELELTETVMIPGKDSAVAKLQAIREIGVQTSLDDFGTGYSSLFYLKHFPLDRLKLVQPFMRSISFDVKDMAISKAVVDLAHNLGLRVVVECVETDEQLAVLAEIGCDDVQGYLLSRPLPAEEAGKLLEENRTVRAG